MRGPQQRLALFSDVETVDGGRVLLSLIKKLESHDLAGQDGKQGARVW